MRLARLAFGVAAFLAAGTASAQTDFYPIKKDSKWVYKTTGDASVEVKVTSNEKGEAKLDTVVNGKSVASESIEVKPDGVYRTKINNTAIEPAVKILELKDGKPAAKGASWAVDSKIQQQAVKGKFSVKEDKEKVKVPLGEFDAVVVDGPEFEIAGNKTSVKYWFAAGKGVVKLTYNIGTSNEAVLELKEYAEGK